MSNSNNNQSPIILASASPRRAELLRQLGVDFVQHPANIDESQISGESPGDYVVRVAKGKAYEIGRTYPDRVILASDTAVVIDQQILGKPKDEQEHAQMFALLSNRTHDVMTAVTVGRDKAFETQTDVSKVTFAPLSTDLIRTYWTTGEPKDKAGGYAIQGRAATFIKNLNGSYSGVMGLPLEVTANLLSNIGINLWSDLEL